MIVGLFGIAITLLLASGQRSFFETDIFVLSIARTTFSPSSCRALTSYSVLSLNSLIHPQLVPLHGALPLPGLQPTSNVSSEACRFSAARIICAVKGLSPVVYNMVLPLSLMTCTLDSSISMSESDINRNSFSICCQQIHPLANQWYSQRQEYLHVNIYSNTQ